MKHLKYEKKCMASQVIVPISVGLTREIQIFWLHIGMTLDTNMLMAVFHIKAELRELISLLTSVLKSLLYTCD